jgi:hypothetical protein
MNTYRNIGSMGLNLVDYSSNPINYCMGDTINKSFLNPTSANQISQYGDKCQMFMAEYCSRGWDNVCEISSTNTNTSYPNFIGPTKYKLTTQTLSAGDMTIVNTALRKYISNDSNCVWTYEQFDPMVSNSPLVRKLDYNNSFVYYEVDPKTIDDDILMDKLLLNPDIALDLFINIYNTMKRKNTLKDLIETKIGKFFMTNAAYFERMNKRF